MLSHYGKRQQQDSYLVTIMKYNLYLFINGALCLDRFIFCNSNYCILNQLTSAMDKCNRNGFLLTCSVLKKWWYSWTVIMQTCLILILLLNLLRVLELMLVFQPWKAPEGRNQSFKETWLTIINTDGLASLILVYQENKLPVVIYDP